MRKWIITTILLIATAVLCASPILWVGDIDTSSKTIEILYYTGRAKVAGVQLIIPDIEIDKVYGGTTENNGWITRARWDEDDNETRVMACNWEICDNSGNCQLLPLDPIKGRLMILHYTELTTLKISLTEILFCLHDPDSEYGYSDYKAPDYTKYIFVTSTKEIPKLPKPWYKRPLAILLE